jgi:hypothetical protein
MKKEYFEMSDGLLFITFIVFNEKKFSLKDIILTCNTLDHTILSLEKINEGISRLECEEYLKIKDNKGHLTEKGLIFYRNNKRKFKGIIDQQVHYSKIMNRIQLEKQTTFKEYFNTKEYNEIASRM